MRRWVTWPAASGGRDLPDVGVPEQGQAAGRRTAGREWMTGRERMAGRERVASAAPRSPVQPWSRLTRRIGSRPGGWLGCGRGASAGTGHSCAFPAASFTRLSWCMMSSDPPSSSR
jgi:hypothetical protein